MPGGCSKCVHMKRYENVRDIAKNVTPCRFSLQKNLAPGRPYVFQQDEAFVQISHLMQNWLLDSGNVLRQDF